jgi:carbonic anhydrase
MAHVTEAAVVHCIDFRFQKFHDAWLEKNLGIGKYDRIGMAGAVFDLFSALKQIDVSVRLHAIKKIILLNHEDCGAYGAAGTPERHAHDLTEAKKVLAKLYPDVTVETYYVHLDGTFEPVTA